MKLLCATILLCSAAMIKTYSHLNTGQGSFGPDIVLDVFPVALFLLSLYFFWSYYRDERKKK